MNDEIETTIIEPDVECAEATPIEAGESEELLDATALKAELDSLKLQLEESRAMYDRLHSECMEFSSLYPDVPLSSIPDSIWNSVKSGIPLAAAYALAEKKESAARAKAMDVNSKNHLQSCGAVGASGNGEFFSPTEVRAMSAPRSRQTIQRS